MMDIYHHIPDPVLLQVFDIALQQAFNHLPAPGLGMMVRPGLKRVPSPAARIIALEMKGVFIPANIT